MLLKIKNQMFLVVLFCTTFAICSSGCKKLIEIPPPVTSITTAQVFNSDAQANSALAGIYTKMSKDQGTAIGGFSNGGITVFTGLSSDELIPYYNTGDYQQFYSNILLSTNGSILSGLWAPPYFYIYQTNAIIAGLTISSGVDDSARNEFIGEAKFIRAFCYFYLTNLFGDVPLALTTDFNKISSMPRTPQTQVYKQIVQDLQDAQGLLATDYSVGAGERIRPNKWAAKGLLARTYLYMQQWDSAEVQSSAVINNSLYGLVPDLTHVFDKNTSEAIWQLQLNTATSPYNETYEGADFLPYLPTTGVSISDINSDPTTYIPLFFLNNQIVNTFENGDQRLVKWIDTATVLGTLYYYPYKYTIGPEQIVTSGNPSQYYMMMRLSEQYLIRAEARAEQKNNLAGAASDLNTIRSRAGLSPTGMSSQAGLLTAIYHESQVEFFAEWGHRWLDLKRTGQAGNVLGPIKPSWDIHDEIYPIPQSELLLNTALTQNLGY